MKGFRRHLSIPHKFVCLSDMRLKFCRTIPLRYNWKGWWSKVELFRPLLFKGPVFYCDLDTIIVGPLDDMVMGYRFMTLQNFTEPEYLSSAVMGWNYDLSVIFRRFRRNPVAQMRDHRPDKWGDQGFIQKAAPIKPKFFQSKFPGRIVSYKLHVEKNGIPDGVSMIAFHGRPRPWLTDLWQS